MKYWKDFESLVALSVTACPPLAIREALREAVDIFCVKTHLWQIELSPLGTTANVSDYDLPIDLDQRVVTVMSVKYKDMPVAAMTTEQMDKSLVSWTADGASTTPMSFRVFLEDGAQFIRLYPTPSETEAGVLKIRVAVKPLSSAEYIPDFFYEDWRRPIASGAISRLCAIPGKEYSQPELATYHERLFQTGMSKAMSRLYAGNTQRGLRVQPRRFGS